MEIKRSIKEIEGAIVDLEDSVKATQNAKLKAMWWNRRRALLWLVGQYKEII